VRASRRDRSSSSASTGRPFSCSRTQEASHLTASSAMEIGNFLRSPYQLHLAGYMNAVSFTRTSSHNVLVDILTGQTWFTGFGIASRLPRKRQSPDIAPSSLCAIPGRVLIRNVSSASSRVSTRRSPTDLLINRLMKVPNDPSVKARVRMSSARNGRYASRLEGIHEGRCCAKLPQSCYPGWSMDETMILGL
jgi:hypothetical protein